MTELSAGDPPGRVPQVEQPPPGTDPGHEALTRGGTEPVWPSGEPAANDPTIEPPSTPAGAVNPDPADLAEVTWAALDAPGDFPHMRRAAMGVRLAVEALARRGSLPQEFCASIGAAVALDRGEQAAGATIVPLAKRTGAHLLYHLALEVGSAAEAGNQLDEGSLVIFGTWFVRRMVEPSWTPGGPATARLRAALVRPDGCAARGWTDHGRRRALNRGLRFLLDAIGKQATAARRIGLAPQPTPEEVPDAPLAIFNRAFRRRFNNLVEFSTRNQVAGASGYGTLSLNGLRSEGVRLADRIHAGEPEAVHIALRVINHLPGETQQRMPVILDNSPPPDGALAWIDLPRRHLCYVLFRLVERGARPEAGTGVLYEVAGQVVRIALSPLLAEPLERAAAGRSGVVFVGDLLGEVVLHPRSGIDERKGYRVTVRRLQESLPAHLLRKGMHRWAVALATSSQFLLSRGRPAYSICTRQMITDAVNAGYELLGWPIAPGDQHDELIGSFVTPRADSISAMLNDLAGRADRRRRPSGSRSELIEEFNAHAAWLSAVLALCLALRKSVTYELARAELVVGGAAHVDDKHVHATMGPPVPVVDFLAQSIEAWLAYCLRFAHRLRSLGDGPSVKLAHRIETRVADTRTMEPVFTIGPIEELIGVGTGTWREAVPSAQRLIENFGRHFWPFQLMQRGVSQLVIDVLMRHQVDALRPEGSSGSRARSSVQPRLRRAMNEVIAGLRLRLPQGLRDE